jgi:hypothetical protein
MDIKKILVIFILVVAYSIFFWPTLYLYTNTAQNILVRINRITGDAYYFLGDGYWRKISNKENSIELGKSDRKEEKEYTVFKPIELEEEEKTINDIGFIIPSEEK